MYEWCRQPGKSVLMHRKHCYARAEPRNAINSEVILILSWGGESVAAGGWWGEYRWVQERGEGWGCGCLPWGVIRLCRVRKGRLCSLNSNSHNFVPCGFSFWVSPDRDYMQIKQSRDRFITKKLLTQGLIRSCVGFSGIDGSFDSWNKTRVLY